MAQGLDRGLRSLTREFGGEVKMQIRPPEFDGSLDYLPAATPFNGETFEGGALMLILATAPNASTVAPAGIAVFHSSANGSVISTLRQAVTSLNHFGVFFIPENYRALARDYVAGNIELAELVVQLRTDLRSVRKGDMSPPVSLLPQN